MPVKNIESLAQSILTLLKDKQLQQRMGQAGRAKAVQEFDVHHVVQQYLTLYGVNHG